MNYILLNISIFGNALVEKTMDQILKEVPFGSKISIKNTQFDYSYVLIPIIQTVNSEDFELAKPKLNRSISGDISEDEVFSIYTVFKQILDDDKAMSIDIISSLTDTSFDILYTDGSFKKDTGKSSYACCQLINPEEGRSQLLEELTGKNFSYNAYNGIIDDSTNNIGELTGIKVASEHFGDKFYQVIISDSEYSIKCFREWFYVWKNNDFKNYAKKTIKNKDLIISTFDSLFSKNKVVLFKWTQGHNDNPFNEKCDELAKGALGIEK